MSSLPSLPGFYERVAETGASWRRSLADAGANIPQALRALVRADELWLVALAASIGVAAGLAVVGMHLTSEWMHMTLFGLEAGQRLSAMPKVDAIRALLVPTLGGLALGLVGLALARWRPQRAVDPIEANALHGGTMSLGDSLVLVGQTVLSNGVGASVGLEAGYAQIGSAMASKLGRAFRLRRSDLRLLVGCGAAGAIAAAFNAPLTGAFYAFELVIGTYALSTLAPVVAAAITAVSVMRVLTGGTAGFDIRVPTVIETVDYVPILALGMLCALGGVALMRGVTLVEAGFRRSGAPTWARPMLGGLLVGAFALVSPAVRESGHAALSVALDAPYSMEQVALLIVLKATASAPRSGWRPASRRSDRPSRRGWAGRSGCGGPTCGCWWAAAPPAPSRRRSTLR